MAQTKKRKITYRDKPKAVIFNSRAAKCTHLAMFNRAASDQQYGRINTKWKKWLQIAEELGAWLPLSSMLMCPWASVTAPSSSKIDKRSSWFCRFRRICPWCHMRLGVLPVYQAVIYTASIYGNLPRILNLSAGEKLPELSLARYTYEQSNLILDVDSEGKGFVGLARQSRDTFRGRMKRQKHLGSIRSGFCWYGKQGWTYRSDLLLLVLTKDIPLAVEVGVTYHSLAQVEEDWDAVELRIRKCVAAFCRYPIGLLDSRFVEENLACVQELCKQRYKMMSYAGLLNNKSGRDAWDTIIKK